MTFASKNSSFCIVPSMLRLAIHLHALYKEFYFSKRGLSDSNCTVHMISKEIWKCKIRMNDCYIFEASHSVNAVLHVQLEYAALDAVVLVHIFRRLPGHGHDKPEWKSRIVCYHTSFLPIFLFCKFYFSSVIAFFLFL